MQGILIVDKPMEWTSFDVIAKLRGNEVAQKYIVKMKEILGK